MSHQHWSIYCRIHCSLKKCACPPPFSSFTEWPAPSTSFGLEITKWRKVAIDEPPLHPLWIFLGLSKRWEQGKVMALTFPKCWRIFHRFRRCAPHLQLTEYLILTCFSFPKGFIMAGICYNASYTKVPIKMPACFKRGILFILCWY